MQSITGKSPPILHAVFSSSGICLCLIAILNKSLSFWSSSDAYNFSTVNLLVCGALFIVLGISIRPFKSETTILHPYGFVIGLWLVFFSDWLCRPFNFLQGPSIRGEILLFSIVGFFLLKRDILKSFKWLLLTAVLICIFSFFTASAGRLIFSDDHTVFLYRLSLLKQNFPFIPFYDPYWNGGSDARDFFATGALNVFALFAPLIYAFPVEEIYNFIVIAQLFIFTPAMMVLACRTAGMQTPASSIAALLSFCTSIFWYRWGLQYGTMGFITSLALIPFNLVAGAKLIEDTDAIPKWLPFVFVVTFSLMLLWSLSGLAFVPIALLGTLKLKSLLKKPLIFKILAALLCLNLPWLITFWSVSNVSSFIVKGHASHTASEANLEESSKISKGPHYYYVKGMKALREGSLSTNPLIILFGVLGLSLLPRSKKTVFAVTVIWLLLLGTFLSSLNPRLELERMLVILSLLLCIPAAIALTDIFQKVTNQQSSVFARAAVSLCLGFLFTSPFSAAALVLNRGLVQYHFADNTVSDIKREIQQHAHSARIMFSGFSLHELSGGHLAPLTSFTNKPLLASSHVHNLWKYKQIIPADFLKRDDAGIQEYMDLYNVGAVFSHEKYWNDYFLSHPQWFEKLWQGGKFILFTRKNFTSNYFLKGSGKDLEMTSNSISFVAESPSAILKFNYFPFLQSSQCVLGPHKVSEEITFIELRDCQPGAKVEIKSVNVIKRILR